MKYYLLINSEEIYNILQEGIDSSVVYDVFEIANMVEQENNVSLVLEINAGVSDYKHFSLAKDVPPESINIVRPSEIGIKHYASEQIYNLFIANNNFIINKISEIADGLNKTGDKDIGAYLNLITKIATNNNNKSIDDVVDNYCTTEYEKKVFKKAYDKSYEKCKKENIKNAKNVSIMSAIKIVFQNS